jgi:hypothetical protein
LDIQIYWDRRFSPTRQTKKPDQELLTNFEAISNRIRMELLAHFDAITHLSQLV